jgi:hypothetical protein
MAGKTAEVKHEADIEADPRKPYCGHGLEKKGNSNQGFREKSGIR